jgi:hypothetical protein
MVKVGKITDSVKSRVELNQDRLDFLRGVKRNGGNFGRLLVYELPSGNFKVVGGNHRLHILKEFDATEIPVDIIVERMTDVELYRLAVGDNSGGAQPFTRDDLMFQIRQLRKLGADNRQIVLSFPKLPSDYVMDALKNVQAIDKKNAAIRAAASVRSGEKTLKQAAQDEGAEIASVRTQLRPPSERVSSPLDVKIVKAAQGMKVMGLTKSFTAHFNTAIKELEISGSSKDGLDAILNHQKVLLRAALVAVADRQERLEKR